MDSGRPLVGGTDAVPAATVLPVGADEGYCGRWFVAQGHAVSQSESSPRWADPLMNLERLRPEEESP